ncbi:Protein CBG20517 [Caenorhabditis briggsae]|uniref:Protein CBG20517 n=1 Tax=Caenorhabditis briggsae TaxID=6238 RepID=A8XXZ7_CAEBR|nr:Protein CBG20517 [Caenorhabditis briggsae]CAP37516.1 Protein CBG20517 [Caenorhabditis briggsae]
MWRTRSRWFDGLNEAKRLIEAEPSKGGWESADIKLRMPTQSKTHGVTKLGLQRNGSGLV